MNKLYFALLICMSFVYIGQAQNLNIPDTNFKETLVNELCVSLTGGPSTATADSNGDGEISMGEALSVQFLNIDNRNIVDLTGLEHFENLVSLDCSGNEFEEFILKDLTHLEELEFLNFSLKKIVINGCPLFKTLKIEHSYPFYDSLDYIDVSGNGLETFNVFDNLFSGSTQDMQVVDCSYNQLKDFRLRANCERVDCSNNLLEEYVIGGSLGSADGMKYLDVSHNQIKIINGVNRELSEFYFNDNPLEYLKFHLVNTNLELTDFPNLEEIIIDGNNNTEDLIIQDLPSLTRIYLHSFGMDTIDIKLYDLPNISGNIGGDNCTIDVQGIESVDAIDLLARDLTISNCPDMTDLTLRNSYKISLEGLTSLRNFNLRASANGSLADGVDLVSLSNLPVLDSLYLKSSIDNRKKNIVMVDLPELSYINYDFIKTLDTIHLTGLPNLSKVRYFGSVDAIYFSDLPLLDEVIINSREIKSLEFDELPALATLSIRDLDLEELTLGSLDVLDSLRLEVVELKSLELVDLPSLRTLSIEQLGNQKAVLEKLLFNNLPLLEKIDLEDVWTNSFEAINLAQLKTIFIEGGGHNIPTSTYMFADLPQLDSVTLERLVLESLTFDNLPELDYLRYFANGGMEQLSIDNLSLNELIYDMSSLATSNLIAENCPLLETIVCLTGGQEIPVLVNLPNLKNIELRNNTSVIGADGVMSLAEFPLLEKVLINFRLGELELGNPSNLKYLNLSFNRFNKPITVANFPQLDSLIFTNNVGDTGLSLSEVPALEYIDLIYSKMEALDFSKVPNLKNLNIRSTTGFGEKLHLNLKNGTNLLENFEVNGGQLSSICVDNNEEAIKVLGLDNHVDNVPFTEYCSFEPGGKTVTVSGRIGYAGVTGSCEEYFPEKLIVLTLCSESGKIATFANSDNEYKLVTPFGDENFTLVAESMLPYYKVTPDTIQVAYDSTTLSYVYDLCVEPEREVLDVAIAILPIDAARPGFDANYKMVITNIGTQLSFGEIHLDFQDEYIDFVSAAPEMDRQEQATLVWTYEDLLPFETREILLSFNLNSPMETPALEGDEIISFLAEVTSDDTLEDENIDDNKAILDQLVVNSYDPNDKTCLNGSQLNYNDLDQFLHYLIRFENTGTASAVNIVVKDIIDLSRFDMSTFTPLESSHDYVAKIKNENEIEFIFENIFLPHEDESNDGFVNFKIKPLEGLSFSDTLSNTADIFFDFNWPIVTNTSEAVVTNSVIVLALDELDFDAYSANNRRVILSWKVEPHSDYVQYLVQRQDDGLWKTIDEFLNSSNSTAYITADEQPHKGINYYRLKLVNADGAVSYSKIKSVNIHSGNSFAIYPNPVIGQNYFTIESPVVPARLILINNQGQQIWEQQITNGTERIKVDDLPQGIYNCILEAGSYRELRRLTLGQ